jgi:hypothetical protein
MRRLNRLPEEREDFDEGSEPSLGERTYPTTTAHVHARSLTDPGPRDLSMRRRNRLPEEREDLDEGSGPSLEERTYPNNGQLDIMQGGGGAGERFIAEEQSEYRTFEELEGTSRRPVEFSPERDTDNGSQRSPLPPSYRTAGEPSGNSRRSYQVPR